jgi:GTP cyclohydrolase II
LEKIRAYNLQDLGHDTVSANLMLGHKADERGYEIGGAILRDLGLGGEEGEGVRVLTNNPDKIRALEKEGVRIVERVEMIPRSWQQRQQKQVSVAGPKLALNGRSPLSRKQKDEKASTVMAGAAVHGEDLDKYLRTKVLKMGHILPLWLEEPAVI